MAADIEGGIYKLDLTALNAGFDRLIAQAGQVEGALTQSAEAGRGRFAEAAQAALAYNQTLAAQVGEQRNAAAATRSAVLEVQRLALANRDLAAAQKSANSADEVKRLQRELDKNTAKIREAKAAILENKAATEQERAAVEQLRAARAAETAQTKLAAAAAKDAAVATKEAGAASQSAGQSGGFLSGILGKVSGAFAGLFAVSKLKQVAEDVIATTSEFQRLEAVLTTINNGDEGKAKLEFAALRAFTSRNPFEVREVTEGYVQLRNRGINPTIDQLQSLANLAAASGKGFEQVTEGLLGATTGQYRRLKEFGVTAKQSGDNVSFTFRGVTTTVEKSQQAIAAYVLGLGELNGVAGATDRIMNTTGGRITNLKDSFTELFATIGEGTDGPLNGFIARLTRVVVAVREAIKSTEQKANDKVAASGVPQEYANLTDIIFAQITQKAKKSGKDAGSAITAYVRETRVQLEQELRNAQAAVKALPGDYTQEYVDKYGDSPLDEKANRKAEADRVRAKQRVVQIRAEQNALSERYDVSLKGNRDEENQLGLLAAARAKLTADEKLREENTDKTKTHALNLLIIADQKVIDDLLEKQDKKRKAADGKLDAALRALYAERATLQSLAAKAAIKDADDASERAKASFSEALRQVEIIKQKLIEKERAVRAAGGRGTNADGVIDGVQAQALAQLRIAALDTYYSELYKVTAAREQRLFDLRADSNAKEVEAVDRKYDALIARAKDNIERQAIEEARQREQLRVRFDQQARADSEKATAATAVAQQAGNTFGTGTGVSVIEAKRAEKKALLEIEQQHLRDVLNNSLLLNDKEGRAARAAAQTQLADVRQALAEVDREKKAHAPEDFIYKLIFGEQDSSKLRQALNEVAASVATSFSQILASEQQAAATRASTATQAINELGTHIQAQIALREEGSASNIKGLLAEQTEQKRVRREALAEQRKLAQEQVLIDALSQASSITTAAANVFAAFSEIPYVGVPLGIAAAAVLIGGFAAAKVQAYEAAGKTGSFFVGGYTGDGDARQTSTAQGQRPYEYHRREFIMNHELTDQYRQPLFEPLHQGRPEDIDWQHPKLRALLPDYALPGQLRAERVASVQQHFHLSQEPVRQELAGMRAKLDSIERTNASMADRPDTVPLPDGYVLKWPNGSTERVKFTSQR